MWDYFYDPYINGYYSKNDRYNSDCAKAGDVIALISSTAGTGYFPLDVTYDDQTTYSVESIVLPFPYDQPDKKFVIQQGAGMCVSKFDEAHEYASAEFLKWFTNIDNNINFAIKSGYLPVKNQACDDVLLLASFVDNAKSHPEIEESLITSIDMFKDYTFYSNKPYTSSYELRIL